MKAAETKTSTASHQSQQDAKTPFFQKDGEGTFFSENVNTLLQPKTETPFFSPNTIQPKLKIGAPNDKYEKEADATAERVVREMSTSKAETSTPNAASVSNNASTIQNKTAEEPQLKEEEGEGISMKEIEIQRKPIFESNEDPSESNTVQRKISTGIIQKVEGEEEEESVMMKSDNEAATPSVDFESQLSSSKGGGSPLSQDTRSSMESGFGADFSGVRIHTGSQAAEMSQSIGAQAFTHGSDIYFNEGKYDTGSTGGQTLLAHELTHTVQQGGVQRKKIQKKPITKTSEPTIQRGFLDDPIGWIKGKIADGLNWLAEATIPGYSLLNVILGKNLITEKPVARSGVNIIQGYMELVPVIGSILFGELKETDTLNEAGLWVEGKVAEFGIDFNQIARNLNIMWEELSIWNSMSTNVAIFRKYVSPWLNKFLRFSSTVNEKVKELRLEGALRFVGAHELLESLKKSPAAMKRVIENPKIIFKYFIDALGKGFQSFKDNFGKHFKNALLGWLFGKAAEMGVTMPKQMNIAGIFGLIAQILGATYQQVRAEVVKRLGAKGEAIITKLEQTAEVVIDFMKNGPAALWERIKGFLVNLKETLFSKITELVTGEIIKSAVTKLVSMLNPAGAIVQLALTIYRVVKYFIDWWDTIKEIASGILSTITKVALGSVSGAAKFIENLFGKGMKLIIGFLASIFGLGGIAGKVKKLIKKISDPVKKVIGKVVGWIVEKGRKLLGKITGKGGAGRTEDKRSDKDKKRDLELAVREGNEMLRKGQSTSKEQEEKLYSIKMKYGLTSLKVVIDSTSKESQQVHLEAKVNPMLRGQKIEVDFKKAEEEISWPPINLNSHEGRGHTKHRHISPEFRNLLKENHSSEELQKIYATSRIWNENTDEARSMWKSKSKAEHTIKDVFTRKRTEIIVWLMDDEGKRDLTLKYRGSQNNKLGFSLMRVDGEIGHFDVWHAKVILRKQLFQGKKSFFILTSFPE